MGNIMKKLSLLMMLFVLLYPFEGMASSATVQNYNAALDTLLAGGAAGTFWNGSLGYSTPSGGGGGGAVGWYNVVADCAADPTGVLDSASAFQTCINSIQTAGGGELLVPTGKFLLKSVVTATNVPLTIQGFGQDVTQIIVGGTNTTGAIQYSVSSFSGFPPFLSVKGLSFVAAQAGGGGAINRGIALSAIWPAGSTGTGAASTVISDVTCRSDQQNANSSTSAFWGNCLYMQNNPYRYMNNITWVQNANSVGTAIRLDDANTSQTDGTWIIGLNAQSGFRGIWSTGWSEGLYIQPFEMVGQLDGIYIDHSAATPGNTPVITITGGAINSMEYPIFINAMTDVAILGTELAKNVGGGTDVTADVIDISNSADVIISGIKNHSVTNWSGKCSIRLSAVNKYNINGVIGEGGDSGVCITGNTANGEISNLNLPAIGSGAGAGISIGTTATGTHVWTDSSLTGYATGLSVGTSNVVSKNIDLTGTTAQLSDTGSNNHLDYLLSGVPFQEWGGTVGVTTQYNIASSTTLANVPGLSVNVQAGKTYSLHALVNAAANACGGYKVAIGGTATTTAGTWGSITIAGNSGGICYRYLPTGLGDPGGCTQAGPAPITFDNGFKAATSGTITVQFAQNASCVTQSSVLVGSSLNVMQVN